MKREITDWIKMKCSVPRFYSFKPILIKILRGSSPKTILEWGCGQSTLIMKELCPDAEIHSIEHDWRWFMRQKMSIKTNIHLLPLNNGYTTPDFPENYFDFIFIDGKKSAMRNCIKTAMGLIKDNGVILLHDAKRVNGKIKFSLGDIMTLKKMRFSDVELDY